MWAAAGVQCVQQNTGPEHRLMSFLRKQGTRTPRLCQILRQGSGHTRAPALPGHRACSAHTSQEPEMSLELKAAVEQTCRGQFPGSPSDWHCHTRPWAGVLLGELRVRHEQQRGKVLELIWSHK